MDRFPLMFNTGVSVSARYSPTKNPNHTGNPLIEALPPTLARKALFKAISADIQYADDLRALDAEIRMDLVSDIPQFFHPMLRHDDLYRSLNGAIRSGYASRNPLAHRHWLDLYQRLDETGYPQRPKKLRPIPNGFALIGMSGVGKSTTLEQMLQLYPQVIFHQSYGGQTLDLTQLVWLKLNCPHDGTTKGLAIKFFEAMDFVLQEDFSGKYARPSYTAKVLLAHMRRLVGVYHLGVLVVDEIQNLSLAGSGGEAEMLGFFTELASELGVPVVLVGTYAAYRIIEQAFSAARRFSSQGEHRWHYLPQAEEWSLFVESLWRYQYTNKPTPNSSQLTSALHEVSFGIPDLAVKIYMIAQRRVMGTRDESITAALLRRVAKESFPTTKRMVDELGLALKTGKFDGIARYEDVYHHELEDAAEKLRVERLSGAVGQVQGELTSSPSSGVVPGEPPGKVAVPQSKPPKPRARTAKAAKDAASPARDASGLNEIRSVPDGSLHETLERGGYLRPANEFLDDQ